MVRTMSLTMSARSRVFRTTWAHPGTMMVLAPWPTGHVRLSAAGIELADARRRPVFVPWDAVAAVRFRWFGPIASWR